jgi:predicted transcriptional regulator
MMTHSWILLAIAFASKESPADLNRISEVADGINISVPSDIELQDSISWLIKNNMVVQLENNYKLSKLGQKLVTEAQTKTKMIWKILETLETLLHEYHD